MSFNAAQTVEQIRKATKGFGTDEKALIDALINLKQEDLPQLDAFYKANYGKSVFDVIRSETSGDFGVALSMVCAPETFTAAETIRKAMKGVGKNEKLIIEALIGRSNQEINEIKRNYKYLYGSELEKDLGSECGSESKKFFISLLQAMRDEGQQQFNNVEADVEALYKAGEGKFGTDEMEFVRIFNTRAEPHLFKVFDAYAHKYGKSVEKVVKSEFRGFMEDILVAVVKNIIHKPMYFADLLESSMKGIGTDEHMLARVIVRIRGKHLMDLTKEVYLQKYGKSLESRIKGETRGDFEKLLIALINQPAGSR